MRRPKVSDDEDMRRPKVSDEEDMRRPKVSDEEDMRRQKVSNEEAQKKTKGPGEETNIHAYIMKQRYSMMEDEWAWGDCVTSFQLNFYCYDLYAEQLITSAHNNQFNHKITKLKKMP